MVASVGDVQITVRSQGERPGARQLTRLVAGTAPALEEFAVRIELTDPAIFAEFRDVIKTVGVLHGVANVAELPRLMAGFTPDLLQLHALGIINPQAMIVRIADQEIAVTVDTQSTGPAVAIIGSRPRSAQKVPISVKHLDAGRKVDNVNPILSVDGGRTWLDKLAAVDAAISIDDFRLHPRPATEENQ